MKKITIAIDGHSSCGKSTMAKDLAREVGYVYVDTGAMYRSVTLYALQHNLFNEDGSVKTTELEQEMSNIQISFKFNPSTGRPDTYLNNVRVEDDIRSLEVSSHVSPIAAVGFVRTAMVAQQQQMGKDKGVVMDGRDIGTTVFPDAELKIFVTASAEVRAQRRFDELKAKGMPADYDDILKNVQERDYIDSHREVSPLRKADDAIVTTEEDVAISWLHKRIAVKLTYLVTIERRIIAHLMGFLVYRCNVVAGCQPNMCIGCCDSIDDRTGKPLLLSDDDLFLSLYIVNDKSILAGNEDVVTILLDRV